MASPVHIRLCPTGPMAALSRSKVSEQSQNSTEISCGSAQIPKKAIQVGMGVVPCS